MGSERQIRSTSLAIRERASPASARVSSAAGISRPSRTACPAQRLVKSTLPSFSAAAFRGAKRGRGMGKSRRIGRNRADLAHHAVGDPARRSAGHDVGDDGGIVPRLRQRRASRRTHPGFRTAQIGGADLHAGRTQRECRRDAPPVRDAARCDHGDLHRIDHLRHQREGAGLLRRYFRSGTCRDGRRLRRLAR